MRHLQGKRILLAVTGSIAAYKSAELVRLLIKAGAEVKVAMTPSATSFISPLTLATLSRNPVFAEIGSETAWNNHVELGLWADAMLVAPASANTLAKMAQGLCDNMVLAAYLSARCPVFFAPAMDLDMWAHPATQANVTRLRSYGNILIDVAHGELASGLVGEGRMAEPTTLAQTLDAFFAKQNSLEGKRLLITAGPTYEPIDPVRYIGNRSSGQMGVALARAAARRGAKVFLVLGPSNLEVEHPRIEVTRVQSAREMFEKSSERFGNAHAALFAAAVSDYRPRDIADQKIKKGTEEMELTLVKNPDIAAAMGKRKNGQVLVGFALETENEIANARAKLERKNLDLIVLNSLRDPGAGFEKPTNKVSILGPDNMQLDFELKRKEEVAEDILDVIAQRLQDLPGSESEAEIAKS